MNRHFAVVAQATELFAGSVEANLTYGLEADEWSQASLEEACEQANCLEFIRGFPEGFQTRVGEKGARLSGGQRQRLSIARAMLRKATIYLLDEATASSVEHSSAEFAISVVLRSHLPFPSCMTLSQARFRIRSSGTSRTGQTRGSRSMYRPPRRASSEHGDECGSHLR